MELGGSGRWESSGISNTQMSSRFQADPISSDWIQADFDQFPQYTSLIRLIRLQAQSNETHNMFLLEGRTKLSAQVGIEPRTSQI